MAETTEFGTEIPVPVFEESDIDTMGNEYQSQALVLKEVVAIEKITDPETFQRVSTAGLNAASNIKAIEALLNPLKERAHSRWKRICDVLKRKTDPFLEVKNKSSLLCGAYEYAIRQKREAEEQAERERIAKEDAANRAAQAEQLAKEGRVEDGIALLESPVVNVAPVMASTPMPKAQGVTSSGDGIYSAHVETIEDFMALVKAVAEGKVPPMALRPTCASWEGLPQCPLDVSFLDKQAKSMKQLLSYPGVKAKRKFKSGFRPKQ
jgi:hypothetical protein